MIEQFHAEQAIAREKESSRRKLLAVVCAVGLTALVLAGYAYIRRFHAAKVAANAVQPAPVTTGPKGPPLAHILIDEPTLDKGSTTFAGVVKNISERPLTGLSISLELHRNDGKVEQSLVPVDPAQLQPKQEGSYSVKLPTQTYGSIKLLGIKVESESSALIAYSSAPGKKRPPERLEPKIVVMKRTVKPGEFLNTPDNPGRLP